MEKIIFISISLIIYLLLVNFFLKKNSFCLDKDSYAEPHKSYARKKNSIPLSGSFFFAPLISIFFFDNLEISGIIFCLIFFILGLLSDIKILSSYKIRLVFQFLICLVFFIINKNISINTGLQFINKLMDYNFLRIFLCTFFFIVLINGFNLIDGNNCLLSLNFLIILGFSIALMNKLNFNYSYYAINILSIALLVFIIFNFFGLNFLGDGAAYGVGFLVGLILVNISLINKSISPFYIANLLWYPAFENLFAILRRGFSNKNSYLPDNEHLHQLIYKFFKDKNFLKKNFIISSSVGLIINSVLFINYLIGFKYYYHTKIHITLIIFGIFLYLITYFSLKKLNKADT